MFSTKGRYALRVMIYLGIQPDGEFISLKDISASENVSVKYLEQIMALLSKSGYVRSLRGNNGGYKLSVDPDKCTAGDILRAVEGTLAPIPCLQDEINQCENYNSCSTVCFWEGLYNTINDYVDSITLQKLIDDRRGNMTDNYCI